ncbi:MAG: hypothetical protein P4L71_13880 [Acetobacteraceae bacterium]|nr:hypothetical protein [Acetobacteraceae bacterium]
MITKLVGLMGLAVVLAGCAQGMATGPRHTVSIIPNCGATGGPTTSPPAAPYDYGQCYPDKR